MLHLLDRHTFTVVRLGRRLGQSHTAMLVLGIILTWWLAGAFQIQFGVPTGLWNDRIFLLLNGRLFLEWPAILSNLHLGYPGQLELLNFPFTDLTQRLLQFLLTVISGDVVRGANFYMIGVLAANFSCAYIVLRVLTQRPWHALAGALGFAFIPFFVERSSGHDYLAAFYAVPLAFLMLQRISVAGALQVSQWSDIPRLCRTPANLLCCLLIATSGVYFSFFALMLWSYAGVAFALQDRSWRPLVSATIIIGITTTILLLVLTIFAGSVSNMGAYFPARSFVEQPSYAMRISDILAFLEPAGIWRTTLRQYWEFRQVNEGRDFWPGPLLSLFALLTCLFGVVMTRQDRPGGPSAIPAQRLRSVLIGYLILCLLFAAPFGIGMIFNLLIMPEIRAQNRIAPYFAFASILLFLWAWDRVAPWIARWIGQYNGALLAGLCLVLLLGGNSLGGLRSMSHQQRWLLTNPNYPAEMTSVRATLAAADKYGLKRVLQLPVAGWPESPKIREFDPYNHFLPFIFSQPASQRKWSVGLSWGTPELATLQAIELDTRPSCAILQMTHLGFDAVMLDQRAYDAAEKAAWDTRLTAGGAELVSADPLRRLYRISPAAEICDLPVVPVDRWLPASGHGAVGQLLTRGWLPEEGWGRWGKGAIQSVTLSMDGWGNNDVKLEMRIQALPSPTGQLPRVTIRVGNTEIGTWIFEQPLTIHDQSIVIPRRLLPSHGIAIIELQSDLGALPASTVAPHDQRFLGLGLKELRLSRPE